MIVWNSQLLSAALNLELKNTSIETGIAQFNSQNVEKGSLFIALKGEKGNGHDYALDAYKRGAACLIVDRIIDNVPEDIQILVEDTDYALSLLAKYKRKTTNAKIIAITGSVGKTSTKEALLETLSNFGNAYASRGSFNNILGVRLELASMPIDLNFGIFEVGMNNPGEIRDLIKYIHPHIAMINNVLPSHIGNFNSLDGIADAKLEIFESMDKDGVAILNRSNDHFEYCLEKVKKLGIKNIYSFGDNDNASDSNLIKYEFLGTNIIKIIDREISFQTNLGGRHRILNLAAILLICKVLEVDLDKAAKAFAHLSEPDERGSTSRVQYNKFKCVIIDDAYNAAPPAVSASLKHFGELQHEYKVVILGDMKELGAEAAKYHENLLPDVIESKSNKVHTVGPLMKNLYNKLPISIKGNHYDDYLELQNNLKDVVDRDMMILFKAANGTNLRKVVKILKQQD